MREPGDVDGASCVHDWVDDCRYAPPRCLAAWCTMPGCGAHMARSCRVLRPERKTAGSGVVYTEDMGVAPTSSEPGLDPGSPCLSGPSDASDADVSSAEHAWQQCRHSQTAHDGWE